MNQSNIVSNKFLTVLTEAVVIWHIVYANNAWLRHLTHFCGALGECPKTNAARQAKFAGTGTVSPAYVQVR